MGKKQRDDGGSIIPIDPGLEKVVTTETRSRLERVGSNGNGENDVYDPAENWAVYRQEDNGKRGAFCGLYDFRPNEIRCADELGAGTFIAMLVDVDGDEIPATKRVTLRIDGAVARVKNGAPKEEPMSAMDKMILAQQQADERRRQADEDRWKRETEERKAREAERDKERADDLARERLEHDTRREEMKANTEVRKAEIAAQSAQSQQLFNALLSGRQQDPTQERWTEQLFALATKRIEAESPGKQPSVRDQLLGTVQLMNEMKEAVGGDTEPETPGERLLGRAIETAIPVMAARFGGVYAQPQPRRPPAPPTAVRRPAPLDGMKLPPQPKDETDEIDEIDARLAAIAPQIRGLSDDEYVQVKQHLVETGALTADLLPKLDKVRAA